MGGLGGVLALASVEFTAAAGWHLMRQCLWVGVGLSGLLVDGVRVSRHGGEDRNIYKRRWVDGWDGWMEILIPGKVVVMLLLLVMGRRARLREGAQLFIPDGLRALMQKKHLPSHCAPQRVMMTSRRRQFGSLQPRPRQRWNQQPYQAPSRL